MEVQEEMEYKVLQELLSLDEISQISNEVSAKLEHFFRDKFEEFITTKAIFQTNRTNLEKKLEELNKKNEHIVEKLNRYQEKEQVTEKYASELRSQLNECRDESHRLQESIKRLEKDNTELRIQKNACYDENNALHALIQRRDLELERLQVELKSLNTQLQAAVATKCQILTEIEEVKSREMSLDFKEKRLEQEKMLLMQQMSSLEEELSKRTNELQNIRSETSARALLTHTRLTQCEEELKIANESVTQIREANSVLQRRCEELTQKLEDQRNHEFTMHASYQEEVAAQTRLADLYKGMADEVNAKADDYNSAVKELRNLLEHATEQYGILESKHSEILTNHDEEIIDKEKKIDELAKEVELANELLKSVKQERLDQAVEHLAPTAAIASRILRKGLSLTQIYTQLVGTTNELSLEREENEKLKSQMEIILKELEEKAPVLQQQRENYEAAIANISSLTLKLDELLTENSRLQEETDESKRIANHHLRENQKFKSELADLARQVCYLLKEIQENRTGDIVPASEVDTIEINEIASSRIISKKLVTFKDIEGLQENNQKLLSLVRTLSSRQEEIEKATDQINSGEMKDKLDRYIEQLSDMQIAQERQAKMLDNLLKQRDMYRNMYQNCIDQLSMTEERSSSDPKEKDRDINETGYNKLNENGKIHNEIEKWRKKFHDSEIELNQVTKDFELYKKERSIHEQMVNEELERLREEAEKNSTRCCRLKAQLDSANERFSLLQGNIITYKSQIKVLEEKCINYTTTIGKHEQSLMILKDEALSAQSRLSKAEVQLENLRQERQLLRDSEGRLLKEREVLQRERHTHATLKADVEAIKSSLERVQAEGQLRTEQRLDDATRECAALRRRLQEEQDQFRELSVNLERQSNTMQERLAEEKSINERFQRELDAFRSVERDYIKRIDDLRNKLEEASSLAESKPVSDNDSNKKWKALELQIVSNQAEIKSLSDQLRASRCQSQQYCDIAESAELQLREMSDEFNNSKKEFENDLNTSRNEIESLKNKLKELESNITNPCDNHPKKDSEVEEKLIKAKQQLQDLDELKRELEVTKEDLRNVSIAAAQAEDKYAREMVLHSADLQLLTKLKENAHLNAEKVVNSMEQKNLAEEALLTVKSTWQEQEKRLYDEIEEWQKRVKDLDSQNVLLHDQIQNLSEKIVIMQSKNQTTSYDPKVNDDIEIRLSNEEDSKSTEQLLQVMKYLRREKDLAVTKLDVLKSENTRLKSQAELAEKRFEEAKKSLDHERECNEISVLTASKHSELLRKVETLNAITDSNRVLREERDLLKNEINDLTIKFSLLSEEIIPLREKVRDQEAKNEALVNENNSLKNEAIRWRQRANSLVERANKASPEDWRRLQTERENLSKLLTSERETHAKRMEEMSLLKNEKGRLEDQLIQIQRQLQIQEEQIAKKTEDARKLNQDLSNSIAELKFREKDLENLKKELADRDLILADVKNKEMQIRKIAKKYKTQYEELAKQMEEEKSRLENNQKSQKEGYCLNEEDLQLQLERESQLREEGRSELRQVNVELISKIDKLNQQVLMMQTESDNLRKEIEVINKSSLEKEERAKQVLKGARTKIMQLTEYKKLCEKEMLELKEKLDSSTTDCESSITEYEARLVALKSQMEGRILRLEHERSDLQDEKDALLQRASQLQRQLASQSTLGAGNSEPPTANIKPMSARTETPLASIRPMSVVVQSRTAAVLPTTAGTPLLLVSQQSQQQLVHTTETSSPTSSHVDYQPASTSRQLLVQPQLNESAESTQREELEILESVSIQQQQQQQCQQQTVALVSPRVEQQQQQPQQQQATPNDQQTIPSSSTQSVSTSHASISHKRPRTLDSIASASSLNENIDHPRQEQVSSPKTKRSRQQESIPPPSANASDIEYQVPTSSQRDQDEEGEDGCVVIVDCDEGGGTHQPQEEEEFDNDPYEEIEEEELPYAVEVTGDTNEVEIVVEEDSTSADIPRQPQSCIPSNQQQQSEAISSAGQSVEPGSFSSRSRSILPMPRQQQQQHLLLSQQGYEDGGDDCIVPSTPTLFVPRRNDGFGEAVGSPQVPQSRFTFGDSSTSSSVSSAPVHTPTTVTGPRTIFNPTNSGLAQVMQEGMDDTRIDLTQLEDGGTGRSVPSTPQQISPAIEQPPTASDRFDEHDGSVPASSDLHLNSGGCSDRNLTPTAQRDCIEGSEDDQADIIIDPDITIATDDNPLEGNNKRTEDTEASGSAEGEDDIETGTEVPEESADDTTDNDSKEHNREAEASPSSNTRQRTMAAAAAASNITLTGRGSTARRSTRTAFRPSRGTRPTPIVWDNQSSPRGQTISRGHTSRGVLSELTRVRGARGRRMRSKYPYNY